MSGNHVTNFCLILFSRKHPFLIICLLLFPLGTVAVSVVQKTFQVGWQGNLGQEEG